jgi:hypothetical protein
MNAKEDKYQRAKKRVVALRGFYVHLGVYVLVNLLLFVLDIMIFPTSLWFYWPLLGWTVAIVVHAFSVFGYGRRFGAEWEERKIREFMENEANE